MAEPAQEVTPEVIDMWDIYWKESSTGRRLLTLEKVEITSKDFRFLALSINRLPEYLRPDALWFEDSPPSSDVDEHVLDDFFGQLPSLTTIDLCPSFVNRGARLQPYAPLLESLGKGHHNVSTLFLHFMHLNGAELGRLIGQVQVTALDLEMCELDNPFLRGLASVPNPPQSLNFQPISVPTGTENLAALTQNTLWKENCVVELNLSLGDNATSTTLWFDLVRLLKHNRLSLKQLRLSNLPLEPSRPPVEQDGWQQFLDALSDLIGLQELSLCSPLNLEMSIRLVSALDKIPALKTMKLNSGIMFQASGGEEQVTEFMKATNQLKTLTHLSMSCSNMNFECAVPLFAELEHNRSIETLQLCGGKLRLCGWEQSLPKLSVHLRHLRLPTVDDMDTVTWPLLKAALNANTSLLDGSSICTGKTRWNREIKQIWLRNQGIARSRLAPQDARLCAMRGVWPQIIQQVMKMTVAAPEPARLPQARVAGLLDNHNKETNATAVYLFIRAVICDGF